MIGLLICKYEPSDKKSVQNLCYSGDHLEPWSSHLILHLCLLLNTQIVVKCDYTTQFYQTVTRKIHSKNFMKKVKSNNL